MKSFRILSPLVSALILGGLVLCKSPEEPAVPQNFDQESFFKVISYAAENYIDPGHIDPQRSFVAAADAGLRSLPYSLSLFPREFYDRRIELLGAERTIPGRAISVAPGDGYVIFIPDYEKWREKEKRLEEQEEARIKSLSEADRRAEFLKLRERDERIRKASDEAWERLAFNRADFEKVMAWVAANLQSYNTPPPGAPEGDAEIYGKNGFGMNFVYFAAANGYLEAMDPHSAVIDEGSWNKMRNEAEDSSFEGIGALLRGGGREEVIVETPLPGSPALRSGLRAGDVILKVDGDPIASLPLSEVVRKIRGPRETQVTLEIQRATELRTLSIDIMRDVIKQTAVSSRLITAAEFDSALVGARKIGYIKIASFLYAQKNTSRLISQEYRNLMERSGGKLDGLILDLRGNPGGYLEEAVDVAGLFLPRGTIVVRVRGKGSDITSHTTSSDPIVPAATPIIVLINAGSASASEIVASALMDHNRALMLGERSFGKATVQGIHPLRGEALVKLTTARYYAPRGYTIQVYGVSPDIELSDELDNSYPPRWREENMWKHLPELEARNPDPARAAWAGRLKELVGENKAAEAFIQRHKSDALKPDFMLIRAAAYMSALERVPAP